MNFFTSDTHFLNEHILVRENRPFPNSIEFKDYIIKLWNSQISSTDTIS